MQIMDIIFLMELCLAVIIICVSSLTNVGCNPTVGSTGQSKTNCQHQEFRQCSPNHPILCPPLLCCSYSQFCYAGLCEDCFPNDVPDLLSWCREFGQYNVSSMRNASCRMACQDRFTPQELNSHFMQNNSHTMSTQEPLNIVQNDGNHYNCHLGLIVTILVFVVLIAAIIIPVTIKQGLIAFCRHNGSHSKSVTITNATGPDNSNTPAFQTVQTISQLSSINNNLQEQRQRDSQLTENVNPAQHDNAGNQSALRDDPIENKTLLSDNHKSSCSSINQANKINDGLKAKGPLSCHRPQSDVELNLQNETQNIPLEERTYEHSRNTNQSQGKTRQRYEMMKEKGNSN